MSVSGFKDLEKVGEVRNKNKDFLSVDSLNSHTNGLDNPNGNLGLR